MLFPVPSLITTPPNWLNATRFPAPGAEPPIRLCEPLTTTPCPLPRLFTPFAVVPTKLPCTTTPVATPARRLFVDAPTPTPIRLPDIRFPAPFAVPPRTEVVCVPP